MFLERGYHGASLDAVAVAAGFSTGAVYSAFSGKADLFLAVLDARLAERIEAMERTVATAGSAAEHAALLARQFAATSGNDRAWSLLVIEFWAHAAREPGLRRAFGERHDALKTAIARMLEDTLARTGQRLALPADEVATVAAALGNGLTLDRLAQPDGDVGRALRRRRPSDHGRADAGGGGPMSAARLVDAAAALRRSRALLRHDGWSAEQLRARRRERLAELVRHARSRSAFYRDLYRDVDDDAIELERLPVVDKAQVMEHFDDVVTDPLVRLRDLEAHLEATTRDELFLGRYRVHATGGSTGRRGVFVSDRDEWREYLAGLLRINEYIGPAPAAAAPPAGRDGRGRAPGPCDLPDVAQPRRRAAPPAAARRDGAGRAARRRAQPASAGVPLRLPVDPRAARRRAARGAAADRADDAASPPARRIPTTWRARSGPRGTSRGSSSTPPPRRRSSPRTATATRGSTCSRTWSSSRSSTSTTGRRRPDSRATGCSLTNLVARAQPLIRYAVSDLVTTGAAPCPCGRPYPLLRAVEGRSDDILRLPAEGGGRVAVHPLALRSPLAAVPGLKQYRIVYDERRLSVSAALRAGVAPDPARAAIATALRDRLAAAGALPVEVDVAAGRPDRRRPRRGREAEGGRGRAAWLRRPGSRLAGAGPGAWRGGRRRRGPSRGCPREHCTGSTCWRSGSRAAGRRSPRACPASRS